MFGKYSLLKGCLFLTINKNKEIEDYLAHVPNKFSDYKKTRDGDEYHLTVMIPDELKKIEEVKKMDEIKDICNKSVNINIFGLSKNSDYYYLSCGCTDGDNLRKQYGLPSKHFHITLGFDMKDNHTLTKNIRSITIEDVNIIQNVITSIQNNNNHKKNLEQIVELYERHSDNSNVLYAYVRCLMNVKDYANAAIYSEILTKMAPVKGILTEFRIKKYFNVLNDAFVNESIKTLISLDKIEASKDINILLKLINEHIVSGTEFVKSKELLSLEDEKIKMVELPVNFSKVDDRIFGSGVIKERHLSVLKSLGISHVINLVGEEKPPAKYVESAKNMGITVHHFPIDDFQNTSTEMINNIMDLISADTEDSKPSIEGNKLVVNCMGGVGRTNMVLACYLIKSTNKSPSEAITILSYNRKINLSIPQMLLVKEYYALSNSTDAIRFDKAGLIMLMGLPCSGKSTVSQEFLNKYSNIIHINQDELGRKDCEKLFSLKAKSSPIILDFCNISKRERKEWLTAYKGISSKKVCGVFFNYDISICIERIKLRKDHPTISSGGSGIRILEEMSKKMEIPDKNEGFDELYLIHNQGDLNKFKTKYGIGSEVDLDSLVKFPRTKHLLNLGSATRDDLIYEKKELENFMKHNVSVEEKVDGANLGFFKNSDNKIVAQNRSHFVNCAYHEQFKLLDKWIESKSAELYTIFEKGNYILYGEWLYMKHSINYDVLPDYFLLFDVFDRNTETFMSRPKICKLLEGTTIQLTPVLYEGKVTLDDLKKLINKKSQFYDGEIEGVYVKVFEDDIVKYRGKIVRSNFLCGHVEITEDGEQLNHWTKGKYVQNKLSFI